MTADAAGGVWTYAIDLARAMPDVQYVIATMGPPPTDSQRGQAAALRNVTLAVSEYRLEWMEQPWSDLSRAAAWLLDLEDAHAPDVIHLNGYALGVVPFYAPKIVVAHSCVLSWWRAVKGEEAPPEWTRYQNAVEAGLGAADRVIAPSQWMLAELRRHYRVDRPAAAIHNGSRSAVPRTDPAASRNSIFTAGRFRDEAKNLRTVAAAAPRLHWPVRMAGDGTDAGRLDEAGMDAAYAEAGIYLFPALYEPFGLSILEAALAGCALVIGDIPSLRELWDGAAVFVPPRDVDAIVREVNALIVDDERRHALARRARARADLYTTSRMAAAYRILYGALTRNVHSMPAAHAEARL
jgi:glycogen synthase